MTDHIARDEALGVSHDRPLLSRLWELRRALLACAVALAVLTVAWSMPLWHALTVLAVFILAMTLVPQSVGEAGRTLGTEGDDKAHQAAETFLSAVPNPVLILDSDLSVRFFNRPARALVPNLKLGEPLAFALRVPDVIDATRAVVEAGGTRRVDYAERVPVDRAVEAQISAVPGPHGRPAHVIVVLRDFTQERRLEAMRADFVANASHELRTPLASLLGFVETLQGPARNDPVAREKFLDIMRSQANRMSRLIDDLLSLSRIELNVHVRPDKPVDLVSVVGHVADTLAPLAEERGVTIALEKAKPELFVLGERDELIRVFENLVENAIKYGASGGKVDVTLGATAPPGDRLGEALVTVRDYGPGIAAEHLPRLTERFYRVDVTQSRDKGGTGLGLAIVKHILARHRGRLSVESAPGQGATFAVRMELAGNDR